MLQQYKRYTYTFFVRVSLLSNYSLQQLNHTKKKATTVLTLFNFTFIHNSTLLCKKMVKITAVTMAALVGSAAAFAPASKVR